jgi:hypothetical protein
VPHKSQSDIPKHHVSKHLPPVPVWFHEPALDPVDGWLEGAPTEGKKIIGIRCVLYSDGSARRWYRMAAEKKKKNSKREKRVSKK